MFSLEQYIGMKIEEARKQAQAAGFQVEVEVGGAQRLNCEYRAGRITFKIENGVVVSAHNG